MIAEACDLTFTYRGSKRPAGSPLSLKIEAGRIHAVTGPNGGGKTTLLRVLSGLAPNVFSGRVGGYGEVVGSRLPLGAGPPPEVGVLTDAAAAQVTGVRSTVAGEIGIPLENRGWPPDRIRQRVDDLLASLGLGALAERPPMMLSGGELQRVLIACALAHEPALLILDDPMLYVDPAGLRDLGRLLTREAARGRAVLVTASCAEEVSVLGAGEPTRLSLLGAPAESDGCEHDLAPAGTETVLLAMYDVSFAYPCGPVVTRGLNLVLRRGEVIGLVGRNGSGKTTLARLALGLLEPDSGRVEVRGRDRRDRPASDVAADIGVVFQNPQDQLFRRSVLSEAAFGPTLRGASREEAGRRARAALRATGLLQHCAANPRDLIPSERRLLSLASMLAAGPPLLILDEPTAGLDSRQRALVRRAMRMWAGHGGGVLAVTHDLAWAERSCDSMLRMENGRLGPAGPAVGVGA